MAKLKFKVKKDQSEIPEGEVLDPKDVIIQKTGLVVEVSIRDYEYTKEQNDKTLLEVEGQHRINKAEKENIERNHPFVLDMSEEDLYTAQMYYEKKEFTKIAESKIEEFEKASKEHDAELKELYKQLPELKDGE